MDHEKEVSTHVVAELEYPGDLRRRVLIPQACHLLKTFPCKLVCDSIY
jgi:hypothetical protein